MKHIYSNTKDGQVKVDKIDSDMYLFQSAWLSKQKRRSNHIFAFAFFVGLLCLLLVATIYIGGA
jgi:hypothetical protein